MKQSSEKRQSGGGKRPTVTSVLVRGGTGPARSRKRVAAGDVLTVEGRGFGGSAAAVRVWFDEISVQPFRYPMTDTEFVVVAPLPSGRTRSLMVEVAGRRSAAYPLVVARPKKSSRPPGVATGELCSAIDELTGITAEFVSAILPALPSSPAVETQLNNSVVGLNSYRKIGQQVFERWMQLLPLQEGLELEPMRAIEFYDGVVEAHGLTNLVETCTDAAYGLGSPGEAILSSLGSGLFGTTSQGSTAGTAESSFLDVSLGDLGFILHEGVKLVKGVENLFKVFKPSVEAGTPVASADVEISLGELFSAIAELIDIVAQIFSYLDGQESSARQKETLERITTAIETLEVKSDRQEGKIDSIEAKADRLETIVNTRFDRTWEAFDVIGDVLGRTLVGEPWVFDPTTTTTGWKIPDRDVKQELHDIEDKVDRLEEKSDRQEEKADRLEEKADREEEKLDRVEEKLDRWGSVAAPEEGTVAVQRGGGNRVTGIVAALGRSDGEVHLRAAIDVPISALDVQNSWTDWMSFQRPQAAGPILEVSIDAKYAEGSDDRVDALLSARDVGGVVYHRTFKSGEQQRIMDPSAWGTWKRFLQQP